MRRRFILGLASVALSACGSQKIVFQLDDSAGDAGREVEDATPPRADACPTAAYTVDAAVRTTPGHLELTQFDAGFGLLPLLVPGPDGDLWFATDVSGGPARWRLDRITSTGFTTEVRTAGSFFQEPTDMSFWRFVAIAAGPDGNMWATEIYDDPETIALVTRTHADGSVRAFSVDGARQLGGITTGPDGNLWFTEFGADARIGRITPAGHLVHFPLGSAWSRDGARAGAITSGPDGNMWFVATTARVGRLTVDGDLADFPLPPGDTAEVIVAGTDGNLWYRGSSHDQGNGSINLIGRVTPAGCISAFRFQLNDGRLGAGLAADLEGNLWFTADDEIVRFTPSGAMAEYVLPSALGAITLGPDGHIWFTDSPASAATHVVRISDVR